MSQHLVSSSEKEKNMAERGEVGMSYGLEKESLEDLLYDTILQDAELESVIDPKPLLDLVKYRAPDYINQSDIENILGSGPTASERISCLIHDILREKDHGCYVFLDCLRQLHRSISDVKEKFPIKQHVLWFVHDAEQALSAVECMRHSPKLQQPCQPFFWKLAHEAGTDDSPGFFYKCCNIFQHIDTSMIVIFPEMSAGITATIEGACRKWSTPYFVVCNDLVKCEGQPLATPLLVNPSHELSDYVSRLEATDDAPWKIDAFQELSKETTLLHESMWLCYLLEKNGAEHDCDWLHGLPWQQQKAPPLTPAHQSVLSNNLCHWEDGSLIRYMEESRLWVEEPSSVIGWVPVQALREAVVCTTLTSPPITPPTDAPGTAACNVRLEDVCSNYVQMLVTVTTQYNIPHIVVVGVNASGCGLTTSRIDKLASENCAQLSIDCVIFHLSCKMYDK